MLSAVYVKALQSSGHLSNNTAKRINDSIINSEKEFVDVLRIRTMTLLEPLDCAEHKKGGGVVTVNKFCIYGKGGTRPIKIDIQICAIDVPHARIYTCIYIYIYFFFIKHAPLPMQYYMLLLFTLHFIH